MNAQAKRAALFLLLATGPLAEVLSENVQLLTLVQPLPFLLVTLTYGVPVLLIRELAVARNLNTMGLALLGLAYGILNEGVLAKTLTQPGGRAARGLRRLRPDRCAAGRLDDLHGRLAFAAQRPVSDSAQPLAVPDRGRRTLVRVGARPLAALSSARRARPASIRCIF